MADIDNLQIRIQADAEDASKKLDKLAKSMLNLASSMSINVGKMNGIAIGIKSISASASNLNSRNISTLATSLNKLGKVDETAIYNTAAAVRTFSSSFSGMAGLDISGIANAASALSRLGKSNATQGAENLLLMKDQLMQFVQGMNSVGSLNFDTTNLANVISSISRLGGKTATQATANLPSISAQLQNFVRQMNQIGSMSFDTTNLANLVTAIGRLGSVASGRAVTNIPLLANNLKYLFQTLSTAPSISQNIIDMTNALANLARTGAATGTAARSLSGNLNVYSNSASRATKRTFSLAAAFGKFYATYWLLIRAFGKFKEAIDISSSLTEVENVVRTTFGNMEYKVNDFVKNSIQQFGMSELSVKQYASTFQAMGSAMGIGSGLVGSANKFLNGMTDGYVGLSDSMSDVSLNLTKLTADLASFYDQDQSDVAKDLQSIFTGMVVPLRKYGLDLTQATLKEWAMKNGLDSNIESMTQAEKTMLRYQYVLANTTAAQGDFARTADTWHNQIAILKQSFQQLAAIIGGSLINAMKPFVKALNNALQYVISFAKTVSDSLGKIFGWKYEDNNRGMASDFEDAADATGDIASGLEDAEKASKKLKNNIYSFDQINKGSSSNSGSASGDGSGSGAGAGTNLGGQWSKTDSLLKDYESQLDTLFKLGRHISDTLSEAMESIDWDSIYEKARNFGTGLAQFLNGLITPRLFGNVGTTIAGSLNTAIEAALAFGQTFDFKNLGMSIAEGVNKFFATFKFEDLAETINVWVQGLWEALVTAVSNIHWIDVYDSIVRGLSELDIETVAIIIGALTIKKIVGMHIASSIVAAIGKSISAKIGASIATNLGIEMASGGGIGTALVLAGKEMGKTLLKGVQAVFGGKEAQLLFSNPAAASATGAGTLNPIIASITGIATSLAGAGIAVLNFVSMWKNGFNVIEDILMGVGLALAAVGAVILGAPAAVAAAVAGIVFVIGNIAIAVHDNWDEICQMFSKAGQWFTDNVVTPISNTFSELKDNVTQFFTDAWNNVSEIWGNVSAWFTDNVITPISDIFEGFKKRINQFSEGVWLIIQAIWITVSDWFNENVITPVSDAFSTACGKIKDFFSGLWDKIKEIWSVVSDWFTENVANPVSNTFNNLKTGVTDHFNEMKENVKTAWNNVAAWFLINVTDPLKRNFETATNGIKDTFSRLWDGIKRGVISAMNAVISSIEKGVNFAISGVNGIIKGFNRVAQWAAEVVGVNYGGVDLISKVNLGRIRAYEVGGFPEDGLFFANHSELVGQFSNGRTAVANNQQIIEGIKEGVIDAMMQVFMAMNSTSGQSETSIEIPLYIGNEEIARATSKGINSLKRRGVILPEFG